MFNLADLPAPDEMGFFHHPDIPGEAEGDDVRALCQAIGFNADVVALESDAPVLSEAWHFDDDTTAPARWSPTPPLGEGWVLVAKFDTEDGPHAMFVQPRAASA